MVEKKQETWGRVLQVVAGIRVNRNSNFERGREDSMGDEHLNTIPATESDEFIKSCVENLVSNPSESEGENEFDVLAGFITFSNFLFDDDYDSDSSDDQSLSVEDQYTINHPIFSAHYDLLGSQKKLNITLTKVNEQMTSLTSICELACQIVQKNLEEKQLEEEQAAKAQNWKLPVCYDDDDDEESSNSLEDNIIFELPSYSTSCVENLVPNPSESGGENECDVPAGFTTFSNVLFDADYDFDSGDDQSTFDEDFSKKIYSNLLFDEEINPMKIDQHSFYVESDLIESMPNHDSSIIISLKIDSLFDEFAGELTLLKSIPPRIDKTDCHPEKETRFANRLLYDNSSPRPPEEIVSDNSNADIESFSPSPIPNEDSDSHMEEINLPFTSDDLMPPGIEDDDYDSGRYIPILEKLLNNYFLSLPANESYHFDIPSPYRPPVNHQMEKSPDLLSHLGFEAFQPSAECPMIINGKNTPVLDKYDFESCDPVDTTMAKKSKLDEDKEVKSVDPSHYHGMIGTLLYLTSSRPDLQFAICMCARTIDTTIDQQVAMDEALVPHAKILRIGRRNFRLLSDIKSKESTLQLVYDVLRLTPFFKAFLVTADVLEIYIGAIRKLTDVNINKLHQPWRSFATIINKCLTGKSSGYDSLRLSQAQILWGLYHKRNVDFAYLMWEDFVYQVEHKDTKKSNEMYYPRFTKVIIYHFMSKDLSIPRRNKVNWHYVRDDHMFSTIKLVSRHQNTPQFGALLPIELTNKDIRNSNAYKEYYAVATGATPPKPKASVQKTRSSSDTTITPPNAVADEGIGSISWVPDVPTDESEKELSWNSTDEEGDDDEGKNGDGDKEDDGNDGEEGDDDDEDDNGEEGDDDQEVERDDEKDDEEEGGDDEQESGEEEFIHPSLSTHIKEEPKDEESFDPIPKTPEDTDGESNVAPLPMSAPTLTSSTIATVTTTQQALLPPTTALSTLLQDLLNFGSLFGFVKVAVQIQSDRLCDEAQKENDEFLKTIDENMQKIIKEQVKDQVKVQVSKILPKIEQTVNEQLEAKVLTRLSHSSKTYYVVAIDLSKMELKKILIEKMEGNKSIQ
nr:hypothetical protein [Tanacetum cinerariifolium]